MRAQLARALRAFAGHRPAHPINPKRRSRATSAAHAAAIRAAVEPLEARQLLSTYYVSAAGSDSASGTSSSSAWKTVTRVNAQKLKAGDKVLFEGGKTFSGSIYLPSSEGGTATSHVTFGSYGSGRATISSGTKAGIDIAQTAGVTITDLNFVGSGMSSNTWPGIWIHVDWADRTLSGINVKNVDVSGYGRDGLKLMVAGARSSISNVNVEHSNFHSNLYGGVKITGSAHNSLKNYVIDHVKAWNNPGTRSASGVTGSGIFIADVDGARINRCVAYNNGTNGDAPVGIWAAGSNRVTIQYSESYDNRTATISDGGGFDFDWDVTNSVMQYNYSHGNDGPGFLLAAGTYKNSGNVVRYNVSENDGRKNGRGGLQMWGNVTNAQFYNNVVYISSANHSNTAAFYAHDSNTAGKRPQNVEVRNNVFYTTGGVKVLNLSSGVAQYGSIKFSGNAYYSGGAAFKIQWGGTTYSSLSAWRTAKGQERLNGVATGFQGDPKFIAAGRGGTIGNADNLKNLTAYKLQSSSPLVNKGVAHPTFLSSATTDFYGGTLPKGGKYDIGVQEMA